MENLLNHKAANRDSPPIILFSMHLLQQQILFIYHEVSRSEERRVEGKSVDLGGRRIIKKKKKKPKRKKKINIYYIQLSYRR